MSGQQVVFGLIEFLISIFISFILIFGSYKLFLIITPKFDEERQLKKKNVSIGIILGSILFGETIVVKQSIYPVMAVIQLFILGGKRNTVEFFKTMGLAIGYIVLAGLLALGCILFSFWLFNILTPRINQFEEIKNNNIAVALFMALFIIAISLLISVGVAGLTRALIPFPKIGTGPVS